MRVDKKNSFGPNSKWQKIFPCAKQRGLHEEIHLDLQNQREKKKNFIAGLSCLGVVVQNISVFI